MLGLWHTYLLSFQQLGKIGIAEIVETELQEDELVTCLSKHSNPYVSFPEQNILRNRLPTESEFYSENEMPIEGCGKVEAILGDSQIYPVHN